MKIVNVNAKSKAYKVYIDDSFRQLKEIIENEGLAGEKAVILTDSNVAGLYLSEVKTLLSSCFSFLGDIVFPAGEENKSFSTVEKIYEGLCRAELDRKSLLLALGGGVTGDLGGFAASTYMRGIRYVQIPTTLLSQVDSSVGGKTGFDFMGLKNQIGSFYQPDFVFANVNALKTLAEEEIVSGMGEAVKNGIIADQGYLDFIRANAPGIKSLNPDVMVDVVFGSVAIKAKVVSADEKEKGLREILNFGHTFGHAIESLSGFSIPHGKCVGLGMAASLYFSLRSGWIGEDVFHGLIGLMERAGIPVKMPSGFHIPPETIYETMFRDKKAKDNRLTIVITKKPGSAESLPSPDGELVREAIQYLYSRG